MADKIYYRNEYAFGGLPLRSFEVFGFTLAEEIGIEKKDDKCMIFHNEKKKAQMTIRLHNHPDNITVDKFIDEFNRLRNLPNEGKSLYDKN